MRKKISVFAYNFPHRKTQDFLLFLWAKGYFIEHVFAADPIKLNIPPSEIRTKTKIAPYLHPKEICEGIGAQYHVVAHRGDEIIDLLEDLKPSMAVISGARILKSNVISKFSKGIINFHPGMIPEARGLDAMLWSIKHDLPLGVTSHVINEEVDAGNVLEKRHIEIEKNDTIFDFSEKIYALQIDMLEAAIDKAERREFLKPACDNFPVNQKMSGKGERMVYEMLSSYVDKYSKYEDAGR